MRLSEQLTVLIPTSTIPSHPDTKIIMHCIKSVMNHLPGAKIIIMCDGVREEQKERWPVYRKYLAELATLMTRDMTILPFGTHMHQAMMTGVTLRMVDTPLILFMEHDTFFLADDVNIPLSIDWHGIFRVLNKGLLNMVGFHCQWEPWTIPEHEWLMLDRERFLIDGVPFVRTWQWSQRPHVARVDFYKDILRTYFTEQSRTMIEDRMVDMMMQNKAAGNDWNDWRLAYYAPEGSIRRTWTEDGRGTDPKFPMRF